jgi:predicted nuclease of restriction endonuclease-like (RecB) superfamily
VAAKRTSKKPARQIAAISAKPPIASLPAGYARLLADIKDRIRRAQVRAAVAANRELICLYWDIGREIIKRQAQKGWGKAVVQRLAVDLQREFPGMAGFSPQNIWYMRAFYLAWTEETTELQQVVGELDANDLPLIVGEIPWGHNLQLLAKLKNSAERLWNAEKTVEHGWSRAVLVHQIELDLYGRQGQAITNFSQTLPPVQSDLARQVLKDPYVFDFLTLADDRAVGAGIEGRVSQVLIA